MSLQKLPTMKNKNKYKKTKSSMSVSNGSICFNEIFTTKIFQEKNKISTAEKYFHIAKFHRLHQDK